MFIITDKNNVISEIKKTMILKNNGNYLFNEGIDGELVIPSKFINKIYEVEKIPENISEAKYCYTEEKGFYKNENYREYYSEEDRISALEDMVNMILLGGNE